jgi:hypothetical protein
VRGDSGGPIAHLPSGGALGIVSGACPLPGCFTGPSVVGLLKAAAAQGLDLRLRAAGEGPPVETSSIAGPPRPGETTTAIDPETGQPAPRNATQIRPSLVIARGCVRRGRLTVRVKAAPGIGELRLRAGRRGPLTVRNGRVRLTRLPTPLRVAVTATTADGAIVSALRTFSSCRR